MRQLPNRHPGRVHSGRRDLGFSLIELMVALVLGMVVLIGLSSVYVAVKQSFRFQETTGRMVEDGNFALDTITRDLRMAGYAGCMGMKVVTTTSGGTTTDTYYPTASSSTPNHDGISGPNPMATVLSSPGTAVTIQPLTPKNFLRGFDALPSAMFSTVPTAGNAASSSSLFFAGGGANVVALTARMQASGTDSASADLTISGDPYGWSATTANSGFYDFVISDCSTSHIFRGKVTTSGSGSGRTTSIAHGTAQGNAAASFTGSPIYDVGTQIMPLEWRFYYIATRAGAETPSLYLVRYDGNSRQTEEEVVSNVEAMSIHYGENTTVDSTTSLPTMQPDVWRTTAASVTDWSRVVALRIGLMMVSAVDNADPSITLSTPTLLGASYTVPNRASSNRLRKEFSTTVLLRNRVAGS